MVSYNVSLFTSNKHLHRTSACAKGSLRGLLPLSPFSLKVLSLVVSSHPLFHPPLTLLARLCGCDRPLLKIIYIYIYFFFLICFYTGYTLLPNNTINRCFFLSSFHGPFSDLDARRSRTKMTIPTFAFVPSVFWKIATTRRSPPWDPEGPPCSFRFTAGGKDTARYPPEITNIRRLPALSSPF